MPARARVTPDSDLDTKTFEYDGQTYTIRRKFKIGKMFRALNENPIEALEIVLEEDSYQRFEDLEMDMDDFKRFMESMSEAVGGSTAKN